MHAVDCHLMNVMVLDRATIIENFPVLIYNNGDFVIHSGIKMNVFFDDES